MLRQQPDNRHHESGRAEPALEPVTLVKSLLHGMQRGSICGEAFDRSYLVAFALDGEHEARTHRRAVEQNRAASANPVLAADVRAGQAEVMAQVV
jgi:hypothetical protein